MSCPICVKCFGELNTAFVCVKCGHDNTPLNYIIAQDFFLGHKC